MGKIPALHYLNPQIVVCVFMCLKGRDRNKETGKEWDVDRDRDKDTNGGKAKQRENEDFAEIKQYKKT